MRNRALFSLIVLCGSSAALAHLPSGQDGAPIQNGTGNEVLLNDTVANETMSNTMDVEPSAAPADPTDNGTETPPEPQLER
ncbi:hypothetical protein [Sphingomonas sp.]|uniref:hypothetical protein n=1 Tax=Sphingomonas sp. TaxID=28214 RepID=UPI001ED7510F|nr:hypothetical protein [Sphingomonas sp.]MBX3594898.1 hypothetical protein [Sphingomonas sp.]